MTEERPTYRTKQAPGPSVRVNKLAAWELIKQAKRISSMRIEFPDGHVETFYGGWLFQTEKGLEFYFTGCD